MTTDDDMEFGEYEHRYLQREGRLGSKASDPNERHRNYLVRTLEVVIDRLYSTMQPPAPTDPEGTHERHIKRQKSVEELAHKFVEDIACALTGEHWIPVAQADHVDDEDRFEKVVGVLYDLQQRMDKPPDVIDRFVRDWKSTEPAVATPEYARQKEGDAQPDGNLEEYLGEGAFEEAYIRSLSKEEYVEEVKPKRLADRKQWLQQLEPGDHVELVVPSGRRTRVLEEPIGGTFGEDIGDVLVLGQMNRIKFNRKTGTRMGGSERAIIVPTEDATFPPTCKGAHIAGIVYTGRSKDECAFKRAVCKICGEVGDVWREGEGRVNDGMFDLSDLPETDLDVDGTLSDEPDPPESQPSDDEGIGEEILLMVGEINILRTFYEGRTVEPDKMYRSIAVELVEKAIGIRETVKGTRDESEPPIVFRENFHPALYLKVDVRDARYDEERDKRRIVQSLFELARRIDRSYIKRMGFERYDAYQEDESAMWRGDRRAVMGTQRLPAYPYWADKVRQLAEMIASGWGIDMAVALANTADLPRQED